MLQQIGKTTDPYTLRALAQALQSWRSISLSKARWRWSGYALVTCSVFILGTCLGFAVLFGVGEANEYHMFYLLFLPIIWVGMREGYAGVAVALVAIQLGLVATTTYVGLEAKDFSVYQMLMLVLSITGLLLGAVITEREQAAQLLRQQQTELAHVSAYAIAGAMGMALAHEISQPLSTVASYLHAARRLLQSGAASAPVIDALSKAEMKCWSASGISSQAANWTWSR